MTPNIPLIAWAPDADTTRPGVVAEVDNLYPTVRGYAPDFSPADGEYTTASIADRVFGAQLVRFATNTPLLMVGTGSSIYSVFADIVTDVSRASASVTTSLGGPWRFAAVGNTALAVSVDNTLQQNAAPQPSGSRFTDVSGAPRGATIAVSNNFVLIGAASDGSFGTGQNGWWCSALEDFTSWTPDAATQCARGLLTATPGAIQQFVSYGPYVIAFKRGSMYRGSYTGQPDQPWTWPVISGSVGSIGADAAVDADGVLYWMSDTGFYRFNGGSPQRITSAPWEWMLSTLDYREYWPYARAVWDPVRRLVRWYLLGASLMYDRCIAYHVDTDRWGQGACNAECVANNNAEYVPTVINATPRYTLSPLVVIEPTTHAIKALTGTPAGSSWTTGDMGDDDTALTLTRARVRNFSAPSSSLARHYYRNVLSDSLTDGTASSVSDGKYDFSQTARWHRIRFEQTGMYEVSGFSIEPRPAGKR